MWFTISEGSTHRTLQIATLPKGFLSLYDKAQNHYNQVIMKYLGIDFGLKRVGIAVSDDTGSIAFPKDVFPNDSLLLEKVLELCQQAGVGSIVVGESKDFSGNDNSVMTQARIFAHDLKEKTKLPVYFEPEFLTSIEAERLQGKNDMLDASAAALILKSFLDKNK